MESERFVAIAAVSRDCVGGVGASDMRILVVDDDQASVALLGVTLKSGGHEMVVARDGREALDILAHDPIRFVISDWEMPAMSGVELCREIRGREFGRYIYIILL